MPATACKVSADGPAYNCARKVVPAGKRVVILHADDIGMCYEANAAAQRALSKAEYRSASAMVPCPWFNPSHAVKVSAAATRVIRNAASRRFTVGF